MNAEQVLDFAREAIYILLLVSSPIMLVGLAVGLTVAVFQALTQIQEITLTFVPKIIVVFLSMLLLLPFMLQQMEGLMQVVADRIVAIN
ncbi:MAG: flagellar biosynthesis protein FliQ [Marivibrio sp.]|uniref:flagellar biosynthesis protein FliQ n=1 Tax=Marivibrio sp. TaxID=2039719 RepID=UPI0032F003C8